MSLQVEGRCRVVRGQGHTRCTLDPKLLPMLTSSSIFVLAYPTMRIPFGRNPLLYKPNKAGKVLKGSHKVVSVILS